MVQQVLRGDCCVIEKAIAAILVGLRMVSGRTAQREGRSLAAPNRLGPGERDIGRLTDRSPGVFGQRRSGIEGVIAQFPVDEGRYAVFAHAASMPGIGERIAGPARRPPGVVTGLDERHHAGIMHPEQRLAPKRGGRQNRPKPDLFDAREDRFGALGLLMGRDKLAEHELALADMEQLVRRIECLHRPFLNCIARSA